MDERRQLSPPADRRREASPARALAEQREQVKRFVAEIAEASDVAEQEIAASVTRLIEELSAEHAALQERRAAVADSRRHDQSQQLAERERELAASAEALRRREAEFGDSQRRLEEELRRNEAAAEETNRRQTRLDELRRRLETQEEELEARDRQTKSQRRRIADELREQREQHLRERRRDAEESQRRADELDRRDDELRRRQEQLERRLAEADSTSGADAGLRDELRALEEAVAERDAALHELTDRCEDLRERLSDYKAKLAEAETRAALNATDCGDANEIDEWRRRCEAAQEEIRALKRRLASDASAAVATGGNDWESQKRRLLAALETDFDPQDADAHADRLTIEGAIRITDGVVQEKEQELADLRRRLEERGTDRTVDESLDAQDEYLVRRRAEIDRLKDEWDRKVRGAEIEMSLERAKLARERAEFEERRAEFERQQARAPQDVLALKNSGETPKSGGGRWLARLGLRDKDGA